jgi:hypothetical protein
MALRELNCRMIQFSHLLSILLGLPDEANLMDKDLLVTDKYHIFKRKSITILRQVKQM